LYCRNAVLTYMLQPPEVLQKMLLWHLPAAAIQSIVKSTNTNPFLHETKWVFESWRERDTHKHTRRWTNLYCWEVTATAASATCLSACIRPPA
jgi:hypothetical protein